MLKPRLRILQVGQMIWATVEEVQTHASILVSYQGDLLRVDNHSRVIFKLGERIRLEVLATLPLEFRHRPVAHRSGQARLDVEI